MIEKNLKKALTLTHNAVISLDTNNIRLYAGNIDGRLRVVADFDQQLDVDLPKAQGVEIAWSDKRYLNLVSNSTGYNPAFAALARFVIEQTEAQRGEAAASEAFLQSIIEFQQMLSGVSPDLSESSARGWFSELLVVRELLQSDLSPVEVMLSWAGPFQGQKDFVFGNSVGVEVKSTRVPPRKVQISNATQLEPYDLDLYLLVQPLARVSQSNPDAVSLLSLFDEVTSKMRAGGIESRSLWESATSERLTRENIEETGFQFVIGAPRLYRVDASFPRISVKDVPLGLTEVKYSLEVDAIAEFLIESTVSELVNG